MTCRQTLLTARKSKIESSFFVVFLFSIDEGISQQGFFLIWDNFTLCNTWWFPSFGYRWFYFILKGQFGINATTLSNLGSTSRSVTRDFFYVLDRDDFIYFLLKDIPLFWCLSTRQQFFNLGSPSRFVIRDFFPLFG